MTLTLLYNNDIQKKKNMQLFSLLLFLLFFVIAREKNVTEVEMLRFKEGAPEFNLILCEANIFKQSFPGFTFYEMSLLALVVILALIAKMKRRMNMKLQNDIKDMKNKIIIDAEVVGKLSTYLEESRSRNSGIESPLRRCKRDIEVIAKNVEQEGLSLHALSQDFQTFKQRYTEDELKVSGLNIENIDQLRIKAELSMLRRFIFGELNAVKKVGVYLKALVDEAEDDVDRVLMSEGL